MHTQVIPIFEKAYPEAQALFIFDQSSAHASLRPDVLHTFDMNKSSGGKQCKQQDVIIPDNDSVPCTAVQGQVQKMTTSSGEPKGLEVVLTEHGFKTKGIWAKCRPVCLISNKGCCLACILSQQQDFVDQISMLEELVTSKGHLCTFLPKFHCELNPIEMVSSMSTCYHLGFLRIRDIQSTNIMKSGSRGLWK